MLDNERLSSVAVRSMQISRPASDSKRRQSAFLDAHGEITLPILAADFATNEFSRTHSMPGRISPARGTMSPARFSRTRTVRTSSSPVSIRGSSQETSPMRALELGSFSLGLPAPALECAMRKLSRECSIDGSNHSLSAKGGGSTNANRLAILVPGDPGFDNQGRCSGFVRSLSDPGPPAASSMCRNLGEMEAGRSDHRDHYHDKQPCHSPTLKEFIVRSKSGDTVYSKTPTFTRWKVWPLFTPPEPFLITLTRGVPGIPWILRLHQVHHKWNTQKGSGGLTVQNSHNHTHIPETRCRTEDSCASPPSMKV